MMAKKMYYVSWNDWNGGQYCRSFKTKEEKEKFIERIVRTDKNGNKNYKTWESEDKKCRINN